MAGQVAPGRITAPGPTPYIDYGSGDYSNSGVQQLLQTMMPRWNTQWEDPNMTGGMVDPTGSNWTLGRTKGLVDSALSGFNQQVQAVAGRAPTADEINKFFTTQLLPMAQQAQPGGYNPIKPTDITSAIQSYVPTAFAQPIEQYQQQKQSDALSKNIDTGQGLIDQALSKFSSNLTDPNNPMYQQFAGQMNNLGITPSGGAFQAGLGGTIANEGANLEQQLMSGLGFPSLQGIQGLSGQANQNLQGASGGAFQNLMNQNNSLSDFGRQQNIARDIMAQMQPSGFEKGLGYAGAASSIFKNLAGGASDIKSTSYICKELIKRGLICDQDMDDFHVHIMPAMFKKGRAFWKYAMDGKRLVDAVNAKGLSWKGFKPLLFDRVLAEPDRCKAVDLYASACHRLCLSSTPELWDERVYRTSVWDSLLFLPRLLVYRPFLQALWKCVRFKLAFILDKPKCEVPHGA